MNINYILSQINKELPEDFQNLWRRISYISPDNEAKKKLNPIIKKNLSEIKINNKPIKNKIAIITENIDDISPKFLEIMASDYELTLICSDKTEKYSLFNTISIDISSKSTENFIFPVNILNNNFSLVYFHNIKTAESILLANIRIAPIQVTGYGYPVSTFGAEIDYFICGAEVEIIDKLNSNYSECPVIIPGIGLPLSEPRIKKKEEAKGEFIILCLSNVSNLNSQYLLLLKNISSRVNKKIKFRFFEMVGTVGTEHCSVPTGLSELNYEIINIVSKQEYSNSIAGANIVIDKNLVSDFNLVIEALLLGKPVVTFEGDNACNRISSAILKKVFLNEMISSRENEFIIKILKIINDDSYRSRLIEKIKNTNLKSLFEESDSLFFKKAIEYLLENNNKLKAKKDPVFIEALDNNNYLIYRTSQAIIKNTFFNLFKKKQFENLSAELINQLTRFGYDDLSFENKDTLKSLSDFLETFLEIFLNENFIIPANYAEQFISLNSVISGLIYITEITSHDDCLKTLLAGNYEAFSQLEGNSSPDPGQKEKNINKFIKILTLYSMRNKVPLNYVSLFSFDSHLASLWYWKCFELDSVITETNYNNFQKHLENISVISDYLEFHQRIDFPYFISTYISSEKDKLIKQKVNVLIKERQKNMEINNTPDKKKIAIISGFMYPKHAVYKTIFKFIETLAEDYELTLIHLGNWNYDKNIKIFKKIINIKLENGFLDLSAIKNNHFGLVFYPDIGMSTESVFLSNLRIAPVQVMGYGHPVSTFGSEIDYFITGQYIEVFEKAGDNYSERPIVLDGMGIYPSNLTYQSKNIKKKTDKFIISCSWANQKINYPHLLNLKKILAMSKKKVLFRFFPGPHYSLNLSSLRKELASVLGDDNFEIIYNKPYQDYMELLEETDLALDSYHFGGFNIIMDSLYSGKPIITLEGNKAYNRFAAYTLRNLGLEELVSTRNNEFIIKVAKFINNDDLRKTITEKIKNLNLNFKLKSDEPAFFKEAIDYLITNHNDLKEHGTNNPVFILSKYDVICKQYLDEIDHFMSREYSNNPENLRELNLFIKNFLDNFIRADFIIPEEYIEKFVFFSGFIGFLVSISELKNTDKYISSLLNNQIENFKISSKIQLVKILTLYSLKNAVSLDYKKLFSDEPVIATKWYWQYFRLTGYICAEYHDRIKNHLSNFELTEKTLIPPDIVYPYFNLTYLPETGLQEDNSPQGGAPVSIDSKALLWKQNKVLLNSEAKLQGVLNTDKNFKYKINTLIKSWFKNIYVINSPEKNKIAIISKCLYTGHAVYRCLFRHIESLKDDYELTFINLGKTEQNLDLRIFSKIIPLNFSNNNIDLSVLNKNKFSLIFYPDIGMNPESIYLSNLRIAPLQVMGYGHPVSTFGSEIDYFIGGQDVEVIEKAEDNYSERLVLIPGMGLYPFLPDYQFQGIKNNSDELIIICPWTIQKINPFNLSMLKEILDKSKIKIKIRIFAGVPDTAIFMLVMEDIYSYLGRENVEIIKITPYNDYMELFEGGSLALDPFPFGGYNTVIDAILARKPVITLEGDKAYNRFASAVLKNLDLNELIAKTSDEYISKAVNIINNDNYRDSLFNKIKKINLEKIIFKPNDSIYFKKAIDYLINNHHELKNEEVKRPIIIN